MKLVTVFTDQFRRMTRRSSSLHEQEKNQCNHHATEYGSNDERRFGLDEVRWSASQATRNSADFVLWYFPGLTAATLADLRSCVVGRGFIPCGLVGFYGFPQPDNTHPPLLAALSIPLGTHRRGHRHTDHGFSIVLAGAIIVRGLIVVIDGRSVRTPKYGLGG